MKELIINAENFVNQQATGDDQTIQVQYSLDGQWLPSVDGTKIGPSNYQEMKNLRYRRGDNRPEGVNGYTKINTTVVPTYTSLKYGIQLRDHISTTFSHVVVDAEDSSGARRLLLNDTAPPSTGNFEGTYLLTVTSGAGPGRFSYAPQGNIVYANGKQNGIYAGYGYQILAAFLCDDSSDTNPKNKTEELIDDSDGTVTLDSAGSEYLVIMTRRPARGFYFTVDSSSSSAGLQGQVNVSSGWSNVASPDDNTTNLTEVGENSYLFTSTTSTAVIKHFEGVSAYAYRFYITSGSAVISKVTEIAAWQSFCDLWDGVARKPIYVQLKYDGTVVEDYTAQVLEPSLQEYPIGIDLGGTTTSGELVLMFEERQSVIEFTMLGGLVNSNSTTVAAKYWNGSSWTACPGVTYSINGFKNSGKIIWNPPAKTSEFTKNIDGHVGYGYQLTFTGTAISGTHGSNEVICDTLSGITAPNPPPVFDWVSTHKNRILGIKNNEVYYTPAGYADSWNGEDSSMGGVQKLVFGNGDPLTSGVSLYNRYGSNVFEVWVCHTNNMTFQLRGEGPQDENSPWVTDTISYNIGNPAPLTLVAAEVGFEGSESAKRNVALWVSGSGPVAFDGATMFPIAGLEKFFDPNDSDCVNFDYIDDSYGWYDTQFREWNIVLPIGSSSTTPNRWFVLDLDRQRWFEKSTGDAEIPLCGFQVRASDGEAFIYSGLDNGYMVRLENGTSWNGTALVQRILLGDFWPDNNVWHKTMIRRIKWIFKKTTSSHTLNLLYNPDTQGSSAAAASWDDTTDTEWEDTDDAIYAGSDITTLELFVEGMSERVLRKNITTNLIAWTHAIGAEVETTTVAKCFQPLAIGIEYQIMRDDY
jgi:hypothetical protein